MSLALGFAVLSGATVLRADQTSGSTDDYPLDTCVVSNEELGTMGAPYIVRHRAEGQPERVVKLCCEMCKERFRSNPEKYLAKLDAAVAKAAAEKAENDGASDRKKDSDQPHS